MTAEQNNSGAMSVVANRDARELILDRVFNAPRELVFRAFTEAEHLEHWWGPKGWSLPVCKVDFRPGGVWHYCMLGPGGEEAWGRAVYSEIEPPRRIVYTDAFSDAEGNINPDLPQMVIEVEFEEVAGKTRVHSLSRFATAEELDAVLAMGMEQGIIETWDRLDAYLSQIAN
jgi:uncharacterized protein YndB with AHSA1/START domain